MARMTHEMRTPLSAIIGLANLAQPLVVNPKVADYFAKIRASARALLEVVDDITDFSRLEKGQEMGRFLLGSTVVMLFPRGPLQFNPAWAPTRAIALGEAMAEQPAR